MRISDWSSDVCSSDLPTKSSGAATAAAPDFTVPIAANYAIPAGMAFPADSLVWVVPTIKMNIDRDDLFCVKIVGTLDRSEEHTSELQSLMRTSYAVFCFKKKKPKSQRLT